MVHIQAWNARFIVAARLAVDHPTSLLGFRLRPSFLLTLTSQNIGFEAGDAFSIAKSSHGGRGQDKPGNQTMSEFGTSWASTLCRKCMYQRLLCSIYSRSSKGVFRQGLAKRRVWACFAGPGGLQSNGEQQTRKYNLQHKLMSLVCMIAGAAWGAVAHLKLQAETCHMHIATLEKISYECGVPLVTHDLLNAKVCVC